jgi:hypothetical protein
MIRGMEATGHQVATPKAPTSVKLTTETYISHTGCPNQDGWRRRTGESAWPRFIAILHERYAPWSITLKCEGCDTTIKHTTVSTTPVEDY